MISEMAIESIEELQASGLKPTPRDIVRLNALGLRVEASKKKHPASALDYLPRACKISPSVGFRQPTVGHEIWLERVERLTAPTYETALAVKAFALSRPAADLPDADDPGAVVKAVETFAETCRDFTRDQIYAALDYVIYGASEVIGEHAAKTAEDPDDAALPSGVEGEDWNECVALGVLHEGQIALFGMTRAELEGMTRRQVEEAIRRACVYHKIALEEESEDLNGKYYATVDEIRDRLQKERDANGQQ